MLLSDFCLIYCAASGAPACGREIEIGLGFGFQFAMSTSRACVYLVFCTFAYSFVCTLSAYCHYNATCIYIYIFGSTVIEMHVFTISFHPLSSLCLSPLMFVQVFV